MQLFLQACFSQAGTRRSRAVSYGQLLQESASLSSAGGERSAVKTKYKTDVNFPQPPKTSSYFILFFICVVVFTG
jgi:hypothetical protein